MYTIRSHANTAYGFDVYASSGADGANVQLYSITGGANQKWLDKASPWQRFTFQHRQSVLLGVKSLH